MTRYLVTINSEVERTRALRTISAAPFGTRLELKATKRSTPQNSRLWAMLTDVALQRDHFGRKYKPDVWKALFMHGWQKEVRMIPSLDGAEVVPLTRTSDLSKQEMSELIDFIAAWGAENGIVFHDEAEQVLVSESEKKAGKVAA